MTDNSLVDEQEVDRLRSEVAELRASRQRLVVCADADRRRLERDLHDGVQQQLVALAVTLQHVRQAVDAESGAAKTLLEEMRGEVQQALDEAARLAQRIYPPLLDAGGLVAALRAAAASVGIRASIEVDAAASHAPEVAGTVYFCCVEALEDLGAGAARATVTVRDEEGALAFLVSADGASTPSPAGLEQIRDRVEALGGRLSTRSEPDGAVRVSGLVPFSR